MNFWKTFGLLSILSFLSWILSELFATNVVTIYDMAIRIVFSCVWSALISIDAWIFFKLWDSEKTWYVVLAAVISGVIGMVVFLFLRWVYQKTGFSFMD